MHTRVRARSQFLSGIARLREFFEFFCSEVSLPESIGDSIDSMEEFVWPSQRAECNHLVRWNVLSGLCFASNSFEFESICSFSENDADEDLLVETGAENSPS